MNNGFDRLLQMVDQRLADVSGADGGDEAYRQMVKTELSKVRSWIVRAQSSSPQQQRSHTTSFEDQVRAEFARQMAEHLAEQEIKKKKIKEKKALTPTQMFLQVGLVGGLVYGPLKMWTYSYDIWLQIFMTLICLILLLSIIISKFK